MANEVVATCEQIYNISKKLYMAAGLSEEDAALSATNHAVASARGLDTHGINRVPNYLGILADGRQIKVDAELKLIAQKGSLAYYDADDGHGPVMAAKAMNETIERAREYGSAVSSVKNGNHFGCGAQYLLQAAEQNMIGMVISNTLWACAPFGGKEKVLGNSPWGVIFPGGKKYPDPITLDMANVVATFGKCQLKLLAGEPLPPGWAIDKDGNDTTDPAAPLTKGGALMPFGGIKGYCITVMWELMAAALSGAEYAPEIGPHYEKETMAPAKLGYFFMAIDPAAIRPFEEFQDDVDRYVEMIKNCATKDGVEEVFMPGEIENRKIRERKINGVPMAEGTVKNLIDTCVRWKLLPEGATAEDLLRLGSC